MSGQFEAKIHTPKQPISQKAQEQIGSLGIDLFNILQTFNHIKTELDKEYSSQPHVLGQLIKAYISVLSTQDPNRMHYEIAREILNKKDPDLLESNDIIDTFAREICNQFKFLNENLKWHKDAQEIFNGFQSETNRLEKENGINRTQPPLLDIAIAPDDWHELEALFSENEKYVWDIALSNVLKNQGVHGKKIAQELVHDVTTNTNQSKKFWFNLTPTNAQFYLSNASLLLAETIFEDKIKPKANFASNNPPGTITSVTSAITQIFGPGNKAIQKKDKVQLQSKENKIIGTLSTATFDSAIVERIIYEGMNSLESIAAIRFVRFLIQSVYVQYCNNLTNWHDLPFPGRAQQIARNMGLKSNKDISIINRIVILLDIIKFEMTGITSRLINLSDTLPGSLFSPHGGWIISVEPPLRPYHIFDGKKEIKEFIIPLLNEPITVGHQKFSAKQLLLQWKVTEEFSQQSIFLATHGYIVIPKKRWDEWFHILEIPNGRNGLHSKILNAIICDKGYLCQVDKDAYTLKNEDSALKFLLDQGKLRIRASEAGQISAIVRKNKKPY